jgi:hypothetical protein
MAKMLVQYDTYVIVAVDTPDAMIYQQLRGKDQHSLVVRNTKRLIEISKGSSLKIQIQGMMTGNNEEDTQRRLPEMFGTHSNVTYIWKIFNPHKNAAYMFPATRSLVGSKCGQARMTLLINATGVCTACCCDYDNLQPIGDINTESLLEIWNGEKRKSLLEKINMGDWGRLPACSGCMNVYY